MKEKSWKAAALVSRNGSSSVSRDGSGKAELEMVPLSPKHPSVPTITVSSQATAANTAHTTARSDMSTATARSMTTSRTDMTARTARTDRSSIKELGDLVNDNSKQTLQSSTEAVDEEIDVSLPLKNVRVLVVDDSIPILKMMSMTLEKRGKALITQAKDGLEAVNRCESAIAGGGQDFSVILTDIQMPNLDGMGEARRVRAMEKELGLEPKIIVGISAYTGDRVGIDAMEAGMDAFLPKPFKYETFESTVQEIRQRRKNIAEQVSNGTDFASELKPIQQPVALSPTASRRIAPEA